MRERPPGWYPDASVPGYERWWDGGTWSHVTRPVPGAPPPAAAPPPAVPRPGTPEGSSGPDPRNPGPPQYPGSQQYPGLQQYQGYPAPGPGLPSGVGGYRPATVLPATPDGVPLAGPIRRLVARVIDSVLIGLLSLVVGYPFTRDLFAVMSDYVDQSQRAADTGARQPDLVAMFSDERYLAASTGLAVVQFALGAGYHITLIALRGATFGKLMVGLRVRLWVQEGRPTWREAALRWAGRDLPTLLTLAGVLPFVGGAYSLIDGLWLLWDHRRQCLHDKLPGTVVVRTGRL